MNGHEAEHPCILIGFQSPVLVTREANGMCLYLIRRHRNEAGRQEAVSAIKAATGQ